MTTPAPAETPGTTWAAADIFTWSDTREFTEAATHATGETTGLARVIVVQTALCHDPATGTSMVGLSTYYISCDTADDPLFSNRTTYITTEAVEVGLPCEVEAARVLADVDPATLTWKDGTEPDVDDCSARDEWVARHWPADDDIFARHHANT